MSTSLSHGIVLARAGSGPQLTSRQQFQMLDRLLTLALLPLQRETEAFWEWVAEMLASTIKSRRKNADEMMQAYSAVLSGSRRGIDMLFGSGINRGHAFSLLLRVQRVHASMLQAEVGLYQRGSNREEHLRVLHECRQTLGHGPRVSPACVTSGYWHDRAVEWRNQIVDHYLKLLFKGSAAMSRASGGRVELDPTFHQAWVDAVSVVNRFRSDQGVFASFLGRSLRGTYRVAASNALGLAAPGARVQSDVALQTTPLEAAIELADEHSHDHREYRDDVTMRALLALAHDPDVRAVLMLSDVNPVHAMQSMGLTPTVVKATSEEKEANMNMHNEERES